MRTTIAAALTFFSLIGSAQASTLTAVGAVKTLHANQMLGPVGTGSFDEGPTSGNIPLDVYSAQGLTWATGELTSILTGVTTPGYATNPIYSSSGSNFPASMGGSGYQFAQVSFYAGVATFTVDNITQIGLTASINGDQYLTVWDKSGKMIGQVNWSPMGQVQFIGIDTLGVPIGMVAYGNDNLWAGATYNPGGTATISDTWVWATGKCFTEAQCDDQDDCTTDTCDISSELCSHKPLCSAKSDCEQDGICDPASGACLSVAKPDGVPCSKGVCIAGACTDKPGNTTSGGTSATGSASTSTGTGVGGAGAGGSATTGTSGSRATSTGSGEGPVTTAGGCGCSMPGTSPVRAPWLLLGLLVPAWRRRRQVPRLGG